MDPERWRRVEELYHAALNRRVDERAPFLADACAADHGLRDEVESLLQLSSTAEGFLETPLSGRVLVGTELGVYRIMGLLGVGGMGEVYRARDTRLDREVAIKILPARFAENPDWLARFEREARLLASLNHPRIATIYGLERAESLVYIVLELVPGETLAERVSAGRLDVTEALRLGRQIAEALGGAHERGIIHRDLKPANIRVTPSGAVKLLDFGLAKELSGPADVAGAGQSTSAGLIVGTAPYMSPEQARGQAVDQRADIWAFGCVLYELLTGLRAFPGETASDSLASVLARQPDWSVLPAATPTAIRQLLHGCLDKDLAQRVRDISDVRLEIEQAIAAPFSVTDEPTSGVRAPTASRLPWRWATWIPLGLVLITGFLVWRAWRFPQEPLLARPLTSLPGVEAYPSFSPEGRYVTFMWTGPKQDNPDIYVQQIGVGNPIQLTTDVRADYNPVWSPDGRWIAFLRAVQLPPPSSPAPTSELVLIPPFGGAERKLRELHFRIIGAPGFLAWCPDSSCLIATDSVGERQPDALFVVSLESGQTRQLTAPLPLALGDCNPAISPDSTSMVFRRVPASGAGELYRLALGKGPTARGTPERLTPSALDAAYPAWLPDGKGILFSAQRRLWSLAIPGHSRPSLLPFSGEDGMMPAVSRAEPGGPTRLVYVRSSSDTNVWRVETSAAGAVALSAPAVAISSTRADIAGDFSPDGQRVAFASNRSGSFEIWLADPDGSNAAALTSTGASMTAAPAWSPDGRLIAFHSNIEGQFEIYVTSPEDAQLRRVTSDPGNDHVPSFSRDNRWIYFGSTRSANSRAGDYQIWKMPTAGGEAIQVTRSGGFKAVESLDGRYLYYTQAPGNGALWRVPTSGGPEVKLIEEVLASSFAVVDKGIYYPDRTLGQTALRFFGFGTGRSMTVVRGLGDIGSLLTASPDGRTILYTKRDAWVEDLVMVDNFRSPF